MVLLKPLFEKHQSFLDIFKCFLYFGAFLAFGTLGRKDKNAGRKWENMQ